MGAITRPETSSEQSAFSFTLWAMACFSVIHSKTLTVFLVSSEDHGLPAGKPTLPRMAGSPQVTWPCTISFRYTVLTPGKEGEIISSSKTSLSSKSNCTAQSVICSTSCNIRWATCTEFSWGSFFVPGRRWRLRLRPSGNCSCASTRSFPSFGAEKSRTSTTSTTRTSFLCSVASSIKRAAPLWTSSASWCNVLASPTPNWLMSML
mmetsp:Transcript_40763/g.113318  ORF Transcript_40763/g.113318 Transcript_40763/m.113318 type:complete len:206 (+) Transcript_40763:584-1201(+)